MKAYAYASTLLVGCFLLPSTLFAQGSATESIEAYDVAIQVESDASIQVFETIQYNFGTNYRHGIYRDVPIEYKDKEGRQVTLDLEDVSVTDENGKEYEYTLSNEGNDQRIKIGDPNQTITGEHAYLIKYHVLYAVGAFDSYDEIYWNAIGTGWEVPIANAHVHVTLPPGATPLADQVVCYTGRENSTTRCEHAAPSAGGADFRQSTLAPKEGLTVAIGFAKGVVTFPPHPWWWNLLPYLNYAFFLIPLVVLVYRFRRWWKDGRDPKGSGVIVPQYDVPDGLTPMQVRYLVHESFGDSLSAEIVYLATLGYLTITRVEKKILIFGHTNDFELRLVETKDQTPLSTFDKSLLTGLFENAEQTETGKMVLLSSLKGKFYFNIPEIEKTCSSSLTELQYFASTRLIEMGNAETILPILVLLIFLGFVYVEIQSIHEINGYSITALILTIVIEVIFALIMGKRTPKGVATKEYIEGLKLYLSVAEKDRINFHNAPAKDPKTFETFLPYAMALGVVKEWSKVFEGIELPPSTWYRDSSMTSFNAAAFATNISAFSSASASASAAPGSSSGSGGGGSSGGGGGGGGGGSW